MTPICETCLPVPDNNKPELKLVEGAGGRIIIILKIKIKNKNNNKKHMHTKIHTVQEVFKKIRTSEIKRCREHDSLSVEV